ncbi:MAG: DNA polymerase III subunit alpha [Acidobacteria bacterium]|nr:DNA polymerase III subunit alpha [Acidobacteriota bacterium]
MPSRNTTAETEEKDFVHLHLHTDYSLLRSTVQLKPLAAKLSELGMYACAITDLGNMYGAVSFFNTLKGSGIRPIIGYEAFVANGSRFDRTATVAAGERGFYDLVLLAANLEGYQNLTFLASMAFKEGLHHRPRIDLELLEEYSSGLVALSGADNGAIAHYLRSGDTEKAANYAAKLAEIFGKDRFYLEILDRPHPELNDLVAKLGEDLGLPLVATNNVFYLDVEDARARDALLAIEDGRTLSNELSEPAIRYLRSKDEMWELFGERFPQALRNTVEIARMCELVIPQGDDARQLPSFPIPAEFGSSDEFAYFEEIAWRGFDDRKASDWLPLIEAGNLRHGLEVYEERLKREIDTIKGMGFPGYFLIVWDFIRYAREQNIPVGPGRGSAAGSLVAYCLRITDVDPIEHDLLFERFLNPERISMPDIDIDFCIRGRGEVIDHVTRLYGRDSVCQIVTFGTMASRAAVKDVGRVLGMSVGEVERVAKLLPPPRRGRNISIDQAINEVPELAKMIESDARVRELIDLAKRVEGCSRHTSVHAAGVVISPKPLHELVPVAVSPKDELTSQYPMGDLEKVGMLKMDFLGLTTLTIIEDCLTSLRERTGKSLDWKAIPTNDPETMRLFAEGRTDAVFQFESSGMQDICRRMRPEDLEDLSALNALYRPGPLDGGMIDDFVDRRRGVKEVEYLVPEMEEFLKPTFGVFVYQEQIMQIAQKLGGYSLGDADLMRRAMGKKKIEEMATHRDKFVTGAVDNNIDRKAALEIFDLMSKFADYGFNRSHSIAYALVAFRTAYLKTHHPSHFYAAVLSNEAQDAAKVFKYSNELRQMGLELLPPDINESGLGFTPSDSAVRYGLSAIKGLGTNSVSSIIAARESGGPFRSLSDFISRLGSGVVNRRGIESLIGAGAFDTLRPDGERLERWRSQLHANIGAAIQAGTRAAEDRERGQDGLFAAAAGEDTADETRLPDVPPWTLEEMAKNEKAAIGFYLYAHPIDAFEAELEALGVPKISSLADGGARDQVRIGGIVTASSVRYSKAGKRFCTLRLEDRSGGVKCVAWSESYTKFSSLLQDDEAVVISGKVEASDNQDPTIIISSVTSLSEAAMANASSISINIPQKIALRDELEKLFVLLTKNPGRCGVYLDLASDGVDVKIHSPATRIQLTPALFNEIKAFGCEVVWH